METQNNKEITEIDVNAFQNENLNDLIDPINNNNSSKTHKILTIATGIFLSQFISLLSVGNGFFSTKLEITKSCITPLLFTSSYYFLLFIIWFLITRSFPKPSPIYLLLTFIDSQANFINVYVFTIIRFEYPYIINFSSAIWSFLLTLLLIHKYKHTYTHFLGIFISLIGIITAIMGTFNSLRDIPLLFENMKGLLLCIGDSVLYALASVLQEKYLDNKHNIRHYFIWSGIIGSIMTFGESFVFGEVYILKEVVIDVWVVVYWIGFAFTLFVIASIAPFFIMKYSASIYNIGMACTIFWAFILNILILINKHNEFNILYFVGFVIIILGIIVYNYKKVIYVS